MITKNIKHPKNQTDKSVPFDAFVIPPPNSFLNIDCMHLMKKCPDGYFDLAIVDPPYGIKRDGQTETFTKLAKHKRKAFEYKNWDASPPTQDYFNELMRVSRNQIIWGGNYFTEYLPPKMGWVFWDKGQDLSMGDGELAWTSFDRALRRTVINRGQLVVEGGTIHPTQKPIKLYKWLLHKYAKAGDKILDTHVGSGSSIVACIEGGFNYWGTEIDKDYYEAAQKRIARAFRQFDLNFNDEAAV